MSGWDELDRERDMAAARAVGYLEGMSTWLWSHVGPDLADGAVAEYDRSLEKIVKAMGLEVAPYD